MHINLTVGKPIIENRALTDEDGIFLYNRKQIDNPDLTYEDAYNEIIAQIRKVDEFSDGRLKIDHLDMHHHLCDNENAVKALVTVAKEYNIPVRNEYESDKVYSGRINKKTGRLRINDCLAYLWNGEPSDYYTD